VNDDRLLEAKSKAIEDVAHQLEILGPLRRHGVELVGPCPSCGGRDRFSLNTNRQVFNCRHCGGGDVVALVQLVLSCDFRAALDWMVGAREVQLSPEERKARQERQKQQAEAREQKARELRERAISRARKIWSEGLPAEDTPVRGYLEIRGFSRATLPEIPHSIRYHPALPYMVEDGPGRWKEVHRGPAMIAAVQRPDRRFSAVHRTWIDLGRPKGKITLDHIAPDLSPKKVEGSMKGGAIRLSHAGTGGTFDTLIMAEGIETTLSALVADPLPGAAFWAGVSLSNMSGRRILRKAVARAHGLPEAGIRAAGYPDMSDGRAFVPPPWTRRLIFVQDGDSDPESTRAQLLSGLRRAMALIPELKAKIVVAPQGMDLNDVLIGANAAAAGIDL